MGLNIGCYWRTLYQTVLFTAVLMPAAIAGDLEPIAMNHTRTVPRLRSHLETLTRTIGERSVRFPENMSRAADYIRSFHESIGLAPYVQPYRYNGLTVENVIAQIGKPSDWSAHYVVGAHYDSVAGTVGADDNASAVAVQLETARFLKQMADRGLIKSAVTFVSFALEEPPAYGTRFMGSRVYAEEAKKSGVRIDGMICLEMVGYTCENPGCQHYPFPLMFFGFPEKGDFIGVVGNFGSRRFSSKLVESFRRNPRLPVVSLTVPFNGRIIPAVRLSDHASFWDKGFPAVMVTDSAFYRNPYYHSRADTMEKLDLDFMAELVESLTGFFDSRREG